MPLSKMKLLNIVGDLSDVDRVVSILGGSGVFQPDNAAEFFSDSEKLIPVSATDEFSPMLEKLTELMNSAGVKPEIIDSDKYDDADIDTVRLFIDRLDSELGDLVRERDSVKDEINKCKESLEKIRRFVGLGIDIERITECEYIVTRFGKLPVDSYKKLSSYNDNPYVEFFPCTHDYRYYWGVYAAPLDEASKIDRIFARLYFEPVDIEGISGTPKEYTAYLESRCASLIDEMSKLDSAIEDGVRDKKRELLEMFTALCRHHSYMSIKNHACKYIRSFVLVGWIPAEYEGSVKASLKAIDSVEATFTDAREESKHSPPVKLKNKFFFRPFEYYTEMYGLPGYDEPDPSWFIALTYTLLFGIMFADVGQGILLLIAAIYMYKKMKMPLGALLIPCSVSSTVFGFIFGSVFGFEEVLDPVYKALFGIDGKLVDVLEGSTTMALIYSAVGIGVVLLIIAMLINIYAAFKRGDVGGALFGVNGIAGLVFYASLIIGLVCSLALGIQIMNTAYMLLLIALPLVLIFFREPLSKLIKGEKDVFGEGIGSFVVDNLFEMFEVALSYVTNTMSFLRVGAFILVHAGMMKVVFVLAGMFGPVGYVITVIVGNILVMALEALLVGIQVLRLEYYEMFSRFYTGNGRKFEPVTIKK